MKKLLVLMLVLGLATAANALTLNLTAGGQDVDEITINVSDTIIIGVNSDGIADAGHNNGKYSGCIVIDPDMVGPGSGSWQGTPVINNPPVALSEGAMAILDGPVAVFVATNAVMGDVVGAGIGFEYEFHCDGLGDVLIMLVDDVMGPVDFLTIHQDVPEPMTLSLLGLGGLFLRRRK